MKKIILAGLTISSIGFTNLAQADFFFHSSNSDACNYVAGTWEGHGKATNWALSCEYGGAATISSLDEGGNFTLAISADKKSGSFLCPSHFDHSLKGNCIDGQIVFNTSYGDLQGDFSENSGTAQGSLSVVGIKTQVDINFQRAY